MMAPYCCYESRNHSSRRDGNPDAVLDTMQEYKLLLCESQVFNKQKGQKETTKGKKQSQKREQE